MQTTIIFDFAKNTGLTQWAVIDDVVMGGRSGSNLNVNADGHGVFQGSVSLENKGGFSSIRYNRKQMNVEEFNYFVVRVKGDGKNYRFRVKTNAEDYYSYECIFSTKTDWQTIEIPFNQMLPVYRGREVNKPNYPGKLFEELSFLIGNKKPEDFKLEIDSIAVR